MTFKDNTLGVFDNTPDDTARRVAETLFPTTDLKKIARAVGKDAGTVRAWYNEWLKRRSLSKDAP